MADRLQVVAGGQPLPDPPYSPETRAAGWAFDLDTARMMAGDSMTLCLPALRPWLLWGWVRSWDQSPCGTLPDDDEIVCGILGIEPTLFAAHRKMLMRGWTRHNDGRLYHRVITECVLRMIGRRRKDREKQANYRAQLAEINNVTSKSPVSHRLVTSKTRTVITRQDRTVDQKQNPAREPPAAPTGINVQTWTDWCKHRGAKLTPIAYRRQCSFLESQPDPNACVEQSLRNGWAGLFATDRSRPKNERKSASTEALDNGIEALEILRKSRKPKTDVDP